MGGLVVFLCFLGPIWFVVVVGHFFVVGVGRVGWLGFFGIWVCSLRFICFCMVV